MTRIQVLDLSPSYKIENWGRLSYQEAWLRQKTLVEDRIADKIGDTLVFCEHPAVITLGRASQRDGDAGLLVPNGLIEVVEVERGGHATYHGPGQIVIYPIFKLGRSQSENASKSRRGVLGLIRSLELWVIDYLKDFQIDAQTVAAKTGVWVDGERKIASIGIAAKHWVSYHGIALNLSTGRKPWTLINPCGFSSEVMTDLKIESGADISFEAAVQRLCEIAPRHF